MTRPAAFLDDLDAEPPNFTSTLERLRAGEEEAFDDLVRTMGCRLLAVARNMLWNEQDAQDAVQEAFLNAFKSIESFDGRSEISTWLHRITVNACLMKLRSRRRHPERALEDLLPAFLADGHQKNPSRSWKPDPAYGIEESELCALVRARIGELPVESREIILLRDFVGLDTEQTAHMLGISVPAAKTRLHRARQALKTLLDPHFVEDMP